MEQHPNRSAAAQALIDQAISIQAERDRLRAINADLLKALKKITAACAGNYRPTNALNETPKAPHWTVLDDARAAIAKAGMST